MNEIQTRNDGSGGKPTKKSRLTNTLIAMARFGGQLLAAGIWIAVILKAVAIFVPSAMVWRNVVTQFTGGALLLLLIAALAVGLLKGCLWLIAYAWSKGTVGRAILIGTISILAAAILFGGRLGGVRPPVPCQSIPGDGSNRVMIMNQWPASIWAPFDFHRC